MNSFLRYSYQSEIDIHADVKLVWETLTDLDAYSRWNPFTVKIESDWKIGEKVRLTVKMNPNRKPIIQTEYLATLAEPMEMSWGMNWGFLLKAKRMQKLTRLTGENTHYFNEDVIEGLLSPVVHMIFGKSIQRGFDAMALSLKKHIETSK